MVQKSCSPVEVGSSSHYLQGVIHPNGCFSNPGFLVVSHQQSGCIHLGPSWKLWQPNQVWFVQHQQEPPTETLVIDWSNNYGPYPMKVSCHEEIFFGCRDVELLFWSFVLDFWRMVNHQTRLPFGEYFVLIFANYQTCKSKTIMSWIEHQVRIERRSSINLCKFGAMRYSPPTPKIYILQLARLPQEASCWLYLSGCQSSSSGRIFINNIFTSSG